MDEVRKCSKCRTFSSKSNFYTDISTKDGLNPFCNFCRRVYYNENFDKFKSSRKQYDKNRKQSGLNFILACNLQPRNSKTFKSQNSRKINETFDLKGCSHSFLKSWIFHQLYVNMTIDNYGSLWQIDHCLPIASFNLLNENDIKKCFTWINLPPMYSNENNSKKAKFDYHLYLLQEVNAKFFPKLNVQEGHNENFH